MRPAMNAVLGPDAEHLMRRVRAMVDGGRIHGARPLLSALRALAPPEVAFAELEARLLLREGRLADSLARLDGAIASAPEAVELRICRADARLQNQDILGAAADAAEAVILAPQLAQAKALLGVILIEMAQPNDAVPCLAEAVRAEPARAAFRIGLATALERSGDVPGAELVLGEGIALNRGDVGLRTTAIMLAMRKRDFAAAAALAEAARIDGVADACVFGLRGHALSSLGCHEAAAEAYADALKLAPEDPYVRHLVAAAGTLPQADRAPAPYLETVFDGYAKRFEMHLIGLHYRVPGLLRSVLLELRNGGAAAEKLGPVLDLGCGTGLMAVVLSDLAFGPFVGVDLSAGMLAEAQAKGLYGELLHRDIEAVLDDASGCWPVILAADVFCYFGALERIMTSAHARMPPGGMMAFTVEALEEQETEPAERSRGWRLRRQGRYAHTEAYVRHCVAQAGFTLRVLRSEALRSEADAPVPGFVVAVERTRHDG